MNTSLRTMLTGAVALLAVAFALQGWLSMRTSAGLNAQNQAVTAGLLPRIDVLHELDFGLLHLRARQARYVLAASDGEREQIETQIADILKKFDADRQTFTSLAPSAAEQEPYNRGMAGLANLRTLHGKVIELARQNDRGGAGAVLNGELKAVTDGVLAGIRDALEAARAGARAARTQAPEDYRRARWLAWLVLGCGLAACAGAGGFLVLRLAQPMHALAEAMGAIAAGDFTVSIPAGRGGEAGSMARAAASIRDQLRDSERLRREQAEAVRQLPPGNDGALASSEGGRRHDRRYQ